MEIIEIAALFAVAVFAGGINSVAGGGTFFAFPALLFAGVSPVAANVTSTMAVWPGTIASVVAYRKEVAVHSHRLPRLLAASLLGGIVGAALLLWLPESTFEFLIPWLLLTATLLFAFSGKITGFMHSRSGKLATHPLIRKLGGVLLQFTIAVYGGYFGAGIGILMLALLGLLGMKDIHEMNGLKTVLATSINGVAVAIFLFSGQVVWTYALFMALGAVLGGYLGPHLARRTDKKYVRRFVIGYGGFMTVWFFLQ